MWRRSGKTRSRRGADNPASLFQQFRLWQHRVEPTLLEGPAPNPQLPNQEQENQSLMPFNHGLACYNRSPEHQSYRKLGWCQSQEKSKTSKIHIWQIYVPAGCATATMNTNYCNHEDNDNFYGW
jgi:hypothetical protein